MTTQEESPEFEFSSGLEITPEGRCPVCGRLVKWWSPDKSGFCNCPEAWVPCEFLGYVRNKDGWRRAVIRPIGHRSLRLANPWQVRRIKKEEKIMTTVSEWEKYESKDGLERAVMEAYVEDKEELEEEPAVLEVIEVYVAVAENEDGRGRSPIGVFHTFQAAKDNCSGYLREVDPQIREAVLLEGGKVWLLDPDGPVPLFNRAEDRERHAALAKLTDRERELLGLTRKVSS